MTYTVESSDIELPTPTREGFVFLNWTNEDGEPVYSIEVGTAQSMTLIAVWTDATVYTVTLDANGGTVTPSELSYTVLTETTELPAPTRAGYNFKGWQSESGDIVSTYAGGETSDYTLVATWSERVVRLGGINRYATMEYISQAAFPQGCSTVIVCRGDNFPDALSASGLVGIFGGQVLLTKTASLTKTTADEIVRLGASRVYVIGDENSISETCFNQIAELVGGTDNVVRVAGSNRYATAEAVYQAVEASEWGDTCIVATGTKTADTLSASSLAYAMKAPIFLADKSKSLSASALNAIANGGFTRVLVLGDENSVSAATASTLEELGLSVERRGGANRYETSILIAQWAFENEGFTVRHAAITAGNDGKYADALSASALCGQAKSPVLLVKSTQTSNAAVETLLTENAASVETVYVLGDTASVTAELYSAIENAVG